MPDVKYDPRERRDRLGRWTHGGAQPASLENAFTPAEAASLQTEVRQDLTELDGIYRAAHVHRATFTETLGTQHGVANKLNAPAHAIDTPGAFDRVVREVDAHPDQPHVIVGGLKSRQRAREKVQGKYSGDATRLTDVLRATVLVPNAGDIPAAVDAVRASLPPGWQIVKPNNRFVKRQDDPVNTGPMPSGYRDVNMLVRAPDGFLAELQVNTTRMWHAKEVGDGHRLYEVRRRIAEGAASEHRSLTATELRRVADIDKRGRETYNQALSAAKGLKRFDSRGTSTSQALEALVRVDQTPGGERVAAGLRAAIAGDDEATLMSSARHAQVWLELKASKAFDPHEARDEPSARSPRSSSSFSGGDLAPP